MPTWLKLWCDRRGRTSTLRIITLGLLMWPIVLATAASDDIRFAARPINELIHRAGFWTLMFVLLTLAVTPLRRIGRFGQLMDVRRMLGVGAFCYGVAHISLYCADQMFDLGKVVSEIALRLYLTIGFVALTGLCVLAATSTDAMVRRLGGRRWQRLHQAVYVIAFLALIHFFQQTKLDEWVPTFVAGLFGWLMGYRFLIWNRKTNDEPPAWTLLVLTFVVSALTFVFEAIGLGIAFNVSPLMVLQTAFDVDLDTLDIRPGWLVLGAGLCVVALGIVRAWWRPASKRQRPPIGGERAKPVPAQVR